MKHNRKKSEWEKYYPTAWLLQHTYSYGFGFGFCCGSDRGPYHGEEMGTVNNSSHACQKNIKVI
jgi:hypothetical protein